MRLLGTQDGRLGVFGGFEVLGVSSVGEAGLRSLAGLRLHGHGSSGSVLKMLVPSLGTLHIRGRLVRVALKGTLV